MRTLATSSILLLLFGLGATLPAQEVATFRSQPTQAGDQAVQQAHFSLDLQIDYHQQGQRIESTQSNLERRQARIVTIEETRSGVPVVGRVRFPLAQQSIGQQQTTDKLPPQPVEGKEYRVKRVVKRLSITDLDGNVPPLEEYRIVQEAMTAFGQVNPLSQFLNGRSVQVGESIELPREVARQLLALDSKMTGTEQLTLTLKELASKDEQRVAIFKADLRVQSAGNGQRGMQLVGSIAIAPNSCRVVAIELAGPVGMAEREGTIDAPIFVSGKGKVRLSMAARYDSASR